MTANNPSADRNHRSGFSLLEVLVASGVLVIGLASIAAIMPAAGYRLGEAAAQDRAAAMVANAMLDIKSRGLVTKNLFQTGATSYTTNKAAVFGEVLRSLPTNVQNVFVVSGTASSWLSSRIDNSTGDGRRGFFLEDDLVYPPVPDDVPQNSFVNGAREFRPGVCWGAMVSPYPFSATPETMGLAKVNVAVFRKPGEFTQYTLTQVNSVLFNSTVTDEGERKTLLKPCSFVLAIPSAGSTDSPQWLEINSSWMKGRFDDPSRFVQVSFRKVPPETLLTGSPKTMTIIAFEGLITVSEQMIPVSQ